MTTNETPSPVRRLLPADISDLLNLALPAYLATLDLAGFPRLLPIWFLWENGNFYLPHLIGFRISSKRERKKGMR